jgi:hypothetical protein
MKASNTFVTVKKSISEYGFKEFEWIYRRPSIADLYKPNSRCGIYILRFRDNFFYVGQAMDVVRRFVQHSKIHDDIQEISFRKFPKSQLNSIEQELIKLLESRKVGLRNITLTSIPKGDLDLDLVIKKDDQEHWLSSTGDSQLGKHIINNLVLQEKYRKKFLRLKEMEEFNQFCLPFLRVYFSKCVLQPAKTELSFWCITCLTKAFTDLNLIALCRVNFHWCETLTIWLDAAGKIRYTFHLTKSLLTKTRLRSLKVKSLTIDDHYYPKGGPDQFSLEVVGLDDAKMLLEDDGVCQSIKTFNLRQMQKGATVYGKYHCVDLAKIILNEH